MCMSLDLGKWEASCTGSIAIFGRMGARPWDQQSSLALGLQDRTGKAFPSLGRWCGVCAKDSRDERTPWWWGQTMARRWLPAHCKG